MTHIQNQQHSYIHSSILAGFWGYFEAVDKLL